MNSKPTNTPPAPEEVSFDPGAWRRSWWVAILLLIASLAAWESAWRASGFEPGAWDDKDLWGVERARLQANDCDSVALLGASRLMLGTHLPTVRAAWPMRDVRQLGVNGQYPLASLEALAEDGFCGIALVSVLAQAFEPVRSWEMQAPWTAHYAHMTPDDFVDRALVQQLEGRLALVSPGRSLWVLLEDRAKSGRWPEPSYVNMLPDRGMRADFRLVDTEAMSRGFVEGKIKDYAAYPPSLPEAWAASVARIRPAVEAIRSRGGAVVFIRYPTAAGHWEADQAAYPKASYWDRLAEASGASTLHFHDIPGAGQFPLPDTSHLDYRDAPAFTCRLVAALQGVLPEEERPAQPMACP